MLKKNSIYPQLESTPIFRELIQTRSIKRLSDISFLGAIERLGISKSDSAGSRLDHSMGVAYFAFLGTLDFEQHEQETAIAAAMLHDVGHGPLSHSTEKFFKIEFSIDHRTEGKKTIFGDPQISRILRKYKIDQERVKNLAFGKDRSDPLSFLFHYPINVDTIEGISRSALFFGLDTLPSTDKLIQLLVAPDKKSQDAGDAFWDLKAIVYNWFILSPLPTIYDTLCHAVLRQHAALRSDFFLTDTKFLKKFDHSFKVAMSTLADSAEEKQFSTQQFKEKVREFTIDFETEIKKPRDLALRYREGKRVSNKSIPID
jgi:HD superfamily phosphohydrolase